MSALSGIRAIFAASAILSASLLPAFAAEPVQLITPEEAKLPASDADGTSRNITRGPGIDTLAPSPIGVHGVFRFAVKFKPRNGVQIDPEQVRVTYLREPNVDLTARIKPFITAEGIEAPEVVAPAGEHVIVIEAVDREGRTGRGEVTLTVTAP
ncbi:MULTISPECIES: hypothetical protein [Mesorhizobium]|uniref:Uncharacterized protein n=1 Tax=Mesorhizobium denitrificans TaxID=2294114 RepID=A0A371XIK9_9HYPH|nr:MULTISPECIES: hypothetical protein [Mesorhizobium]RFC69066.1 hypothetical protein DY251_02920 [Mesorhizobium denitrificans]